MAGDRGNAKQNRGPSRNADSRGGSGGARKGARPSGGSQGGKPGSRSGKPASRGGKPDSRGGKPDSRSGKPASRGGKPDSRGGKPDSRGGRPDSRGGKPDSRGGKPDSRGGKSDSRGGRPDSRGERSDSRGGKPDSRGGRPDSRGGRPDSRGGKPDSRDGKSGYRGTKPGSSGKPDGRSDGSRDGATGKAQAGPKSWGGVARRGAAKVGEVPFREDEAFTPDDIAAYEARVAKRAIAEQARQRVRDEAKEAIDRSGGLEKKKRKAPTFAAVERDILPASPKSAVEPQSALIKALGKDLGRRAWRDLLNASEDFADGRYRVAETKLKKLSQIVPEMPEVRELLGLSLYRQGRWAAATKELEEFRRMTGSTEQHPVLADAYRAQKHWADVDFLWAELREVSPSAALVTEGRVVAAGALADQGDVAGAIQMLEKKWKRPKRPHEHHLSRAYALADLYERVGDSPRARDLFAWIATVSPQFSDAKQRSS